MILKLLQNLANIRHPLRPPGAVSEQEFNEKCIRCRKCEEVCPYDAIQMTDFSWSSKTGTPIITPKNVPCYLCDDLPCIDVCPTGALAPVKDRAEIAMGIARIDESLCFAYNGILCRACYERCPVYGEAITLKDELYPVVHEDKCVGCGICESVCPVDPIAIIVESAHEVNS